MGYLSLPDILDFVGPVPLSILIFVLCLFVASIIDYRCGHWLILRLFRHIINRIFKYFPNWFYYHSVPSRLGGAVIAFLVFVPFTDELIVNVTASYVTLLLLNSVFREPVPLLTISQGVVDDAKKFDTELMNLVDTERCNNQEGDELLKVAVTVKNVGDIKTANLQIRCRVASKKDIVPNAEWQTVNLSEQDRVLDVDDKQVEEFVVNCSPDAGTYYVEVRARPTRHKGILQTRKIKKHVYTDE